MLEENLSKRLMRAITSFRSKLNVPSKGDAALGIWPSQSAEVNKIFKAVAMPTRKRKELADKPDYQTLTQFF
jgi:hypothetical protein